LEQFGTELWAQALQLSDGHLPAEREALEKDRDEIEAHCQENADLADQLREREQALAVAHARTDEIRNRATQLTEQLTAATAQNSQMLKTLTEMQKAKGQK
jgi:predicted nuclease with TOPRIM domain